MSAALVLDTPCPDGRFPRPGRGCPTYDPFFLFFDWNSADLTPEMEGQLFNAIGGFRATRDSRIIISGHTDRSGSASANLRLSQRRARIIRRYLIDHGGIPAVLITVHAYGETRPIMPTADGVRERQNSRVEIMFEPILR